MEKVSLQLLDTSVEVSNLNLVLIKVKLQIKLTTIKHMIIQILLYNVETHCTMNSMTLLKCISIVIDITCPSGMRDTISQSTSRRKQDTIHQFPLLVVSWKW